MANKIVIQLLKERVDESGDTLREFRWSDLAHAQHWPSGAQQGDGDALLEAVSAGQSVLLLIPGAKLVSVSVPYSKKEARHFLSLLPYQIEDDVLGDVDDLHFAVSANKESDVVSAAYTDLSWLESLVGWLSNHDLAVETCIPDFQCMDVAANELVLWFSEGNVLGHRGNGLGFSISHSLAKPFLKDLLQNQQDLENPWLITVYVDDAATQEYVQANVLPVVEHDCVVGRPTINFSQSNQLNFSNGKLGKKLPVSRWWDESKAIVGLAVAATIVFFVASFTDIYFLQKEQAKIQNDIVKDFREVVPTGSVSVPVRRLKAMLGSSGQDEQSSQSIYLLSKIAPELIKLKIELSTLNYSNREQILRINVRADSFNGVEQLRQALDKQDVSAELQSSNATDNGFQARLKITMKGNRNG